MATKSIVTAVDGANYEPTFSMNDLYQVGAAIAESPSLFQLFRKTTEALASGTAAGGAAFPFIYGMTSDLNMRLMPGGFEKPTSKPRSWTPIADLNSTQRLGYFARGTAATARYYGLPLAAQRLLYDATGPCNCVPDKPTLDRAIKALGIGLATALVIHPLQTRQRAGWLTSSSPAMAPFRPVFATEASFPRTLVRQGAISTAFLARDPKTSRPERLATNVMNGVVLSLTHELYSSRKLMSLRIVWSTARWTVGQTAFQETGSV